MCKYVTPSTDHRTWLQRDAIKTQQLDLTDNRVKRTIDIRRVKVTAGRFEEVDTLLANFSTQSTLQTNFSAQSTLLTNFSIQSTLFKIFSTQSILLTNFSTQSTSLTNFSTQSTLLTNFNTQSTLLTNFNTQSGQRRATGAACCSDQSSTEGAKNGILLYLHLQGSSAVGKNKDK